MNGIPEPTNDHERTIAEVVDSKLLAPDSYYQSIVSEAVESMPFDMSTADIQFLCSYTNWRLAHPLKRARGAT